MNLIEFAKMAPANQTPEEFIAMMNEVLPLDEVKDLTEEEGLAFFSAVQWLYDFAILLTEFHQQDSEMETPDGQYMAPCLPGTRGPFIENLLTRGPGKPDFTPLTHFGLK
ncbi:hypothetical protein LA6_001179 [Marinibacterium anthonyi]|nr:hypothetical protein LA6_001179 [Marinibacterium anthonyi]